MSSTGNCYDNAITESFFATLKIELFHKCNFLDRKEVRVSIFEFIEVFYNRIRIHSKLDFKTPFEYDGICM
jgi:putative transposase